MVPMKTAFGVLAVGILLCGCGRPLGGVTVAFRQYQPEPGAKVAVLPFTNETADMDIAPLAREGIAAGFGRLGYSVMDLDECDAKLREGGITQAGQLAAVERQTLGELVGADFVVFGEVEEFGARLNSEFKSSFRMVHAPSGETLWVARGDAARGPVQDLYRNRISAARERGDLLHGPLVKNLDIACGLGRALSTFTPSNIVDEEELASRPDPLLVIFGVATGSGFSEDSQFFMGPWASIGRGRLQLEIGLWRAEGEPAPFVQRSVSEFDLGVRRTWREDARLRPFLSGGLSVADVEEAAGAVILSEQTIVMPYAAAGVDWWLPWGYAFGLQIRLGTAAGGAGFALNVAFAF